MPNILRLLGNVVLNNGSMTLTAENLGGITANIITDGTLNNARLPPNISVASVSGNGSGLTSLNASQVTTGTLSIHRIGAVDANVISVGTLDFQRLPGKVRDLFVENTNVLDTDVLPQDIIVSNVTVSGYLFGNGSFVTGLDASELKTGTLDLQRLPDNVQIRGTLSADAVTSNTAYIGSSTNEALQSWVKTGASFSSVGSVFAFDPTNGGWNGATSILYLSKSTSTNRTINAAGTVNASGTDYAEYMTKNGDFVVAKGDIVGVDANGLLTNVYDDAVTFVIKSTNPSLVGGDDWGIEDMEHPRPPDPSSMTPPGEDASEEDIAAYDAAVAAHEAWTADFEAKRARVDRIAFSGQVPVNVYDASSGDYIVPVRRGNDDGGIASIAIPDASITFEQYRRAVGKVVKLMDDGRAFVIVKIV